MGKNNILNLDSLYCCFIVYIFLKKIGQIWGLLLWGNIRQWKSYFKENLQFLIRFFWQFFIKERRYLQFKGLPKGKSHNACDRDNYFYDYMRQKLQITNRGIFKPSWDL